MKQKSKNLLQFTESTVIKSASFQEAKYTQIFAPSLYIAYENNNLYLKRIHGQTLTIAGENNQKLYFKTAELLGQLHAKALNCEVHTLSTPLKFEDSLLSSWNKATVELEKEKDFLLSSCEELLSHMKIVKRNGVYLDANPNNWIVEKGNIVAIDFGHVSIASFASDLAQLFDYNPIAIPFEPFFNSWSKGLQNPVLAKVAKDDFQFVRIFSTLCRVPYHSAKRRLFWYRKSYKLCQELRLETLRSAFLKVINLIS